MLRPQVRQIGVQDNFTKSVFKQPGNQHAEDDTAKPSVLTVGFSDFAADFRSSIICFPVASFTDQPTVLFQNQPSVA